MRLAVREIRRVKARLPLESVLLGGVPPYREPDAIWFAGSEAASEAEPRKNQMRKLP